jgi:hypothetical protein
MPAILLVAALLFLVINMEGSANCAQGYLGAFDARTVQSSLYELSILILVFPISL